MVRYTSQRLALTSLRQQVLRSSKSEVEGYVRHSHERDRGSMGVLEGARMKKFMVSAALMSGFLLQPLCAAADQPKPEDFTNFPIPTKGAEKDPKLVYETEDKDGNKAKVSTSERETSMLVFGGVAVGVTLIAVVGACIWNGKIPLGEISRAIWRSDDSRE